MGDMISLLVAYGNDRVIGSGGTLPAWKLPADLKHFKKLTSGHPIIMGRKTYESIGKPLPGRTNIVVSRHEQPAGEHVAVYRGSVESALELAEKSEGGDEVFVIGGEQVFKETLPRAERMYTTEVDGDFPGDTYFPAFQQADWEVTKIGEHAPDEKNSHAVTFFRYDRKGSSKA